MQEKLAKEREKRRAEEREAERRERAERDKRRREREDRDTRLERERRERAKHDTVPKRRAECVPHHFAVTSAGSPPQNTCEQPGRVSMQRYRVSLNLALNSLIQEGMKHPSVRHIRSHRPFHQMQEGFLTGNAEKQQETNDLLCCAAGCREHGKYRDRMREQERDRDRDRGRDRDRRDRGREPDRRPRVGSTVQCISSCGLALYASNSTKPIRGLIQLK